MKAKKNMNVGKLDYKFSPGVFQETVKRLGISRPTLYKLLNELDADAWSAAMQVEEEYVSKHGRKVRKMHEYCELARKNKLEEIANKIKLLQDAKTIMDGS